MKQILLMIMLILIFSCSEQKITHELLTQYAEAKTLYIKGNLDEALPLFLAIRDKAPEFSSNSFMLGKLYFFKKNHEEAEKTWLETLEQNPKHIDTVKWLSRLYLIQNKAEEAESLVVKALKNSSEDPELLILLGKIKREQKDFSLANEFYIKAQFFKEKLAEAYIDLAEIYGKFGLAGKAEQELEKALFLLGEESSLYKSIESILAGLKEETKR